MMGQTIAYQESMGQHAHEIRHIASFSYSYDEFVKSLETLNNITDSICDRSGKKLLFHVKKGTDSTFMWKATVRVKCHKVSGISGSIESTRVLNLKQYYHLYSEITRYSSMTQLQDQMSAAENISASMIITEIDSHLGNAGSLDTDKEECCICMDVKSDLILRCGHSYCEKCIDEWYVVNKTCPQCRANVNTCKDSWVLAEAPDTQEITQETTQYILGLSEKSGYKDQTDDG